LVVWDASADDFIITAGTASANPNPPDRATATDIILAMVYVQAAASTLADSDIYDCRCFVYGAQTNHIHQDLSFYDGDTTKTLFVDVSTGGIGKDASVLTFATGATGKATFAGAAEFNGGTGNHIDLSASTVTCTGTDAEFSTAGIAATIDTVGSYSVIVDHDTDTMRIVTNGLDMVLGETGKDILPVTDISIDL
jgi:hypothetical protein